MKRTITSLALFASVVALGGVSTAQTPKGEACSTASLEGSYGVYGVAGTVVPDGTPVRGISRMTFDGQGNWSNTFTLNDNGTIIRGTASGGYTVSEDCTGSLIRPDGQPTWDFVIVDGGREFYSLRLNPANRLDTAIGKKQFSRHEHDTVGDKASDHEGS